MGRPGVDDVAFIWAAPLVGVVGDGTSGRRAAAGDDRTHGGGGGSLSLPVVRSRRLTPFGPSVLVRFGDQHLVEYISPCVPAKKKKKTEDSGRNQRRYLGGCNLPCI